MKIDDNFKRLWNSELESRIKLSPQKKEELVERITSNKETYKEERSWTYPVVLTVFIVGMAFFLFINSKIGPQRLNIVTSSLFDSNLNKEWLYSEKFYWLIALILLEIGTTILFLTVVKKTQRWSVYGIVKGIQRLFSARSRNYLILGCFSVAASMSTFMFLKEVSLLTIKILCVLFVMLLNCLIMLWTVRGLQKASCPHCKSSFTRKEIHKMTWAPNRLRCIYCEENIFHSAGARKKTLIYVFIPYLTFFSLAMFGGIPIPIIAFSFIIVAIFYNFYIMNFTTKFSKEDEPLW